MNIHQSSPIPNYTEISSIYVLKDVLRKWLTEKFWSISLKNTQKVIEKISDLDFEPTEYGHLKALSSTIRDRLNTALKSDVTIYQNSLQHGEEDKELSEKNSTFDETREQLPELFRTFLRYIRKSTLLETRDSKISQKIKVIINSLGLPRGADIARFFRSWPWRPDSK